MNCLILSRQRPEKAPFNVWLGALVDTSKLFTSPDRANSFPYFAEVIAFDNYENNSTVEFEAMRLHRTWPFERIVATSEADILRAGRLRTRLGLRGQSGESAFAFRNKLEMKRRLASSGCSIAIPKFKDIVESFDIIEFIEENGYPAVIKPVDGSGSTGVAVLRNEMGLKKLLAKGVGRGLEIERFVDGTQYHLDGLVVDGRVLLVWPSKYLQNCLSFSEGGFTASHMLRADHPLRPRLVEAAHEILKLLPTPENTSFHLELFHTADNELYFCEIASRTGGGLINEVMERAFGVNFNKVFVQTQAGLQVNTDFAVVPKRLLAWALVPPQAGTFEGFNAAAPKMPWVSLFNWTLEPGTSSSGPQSSVDQMASFIVEFDNDMQAEERLTETETWAIQNARWKAA